MFGHDYFGDDFYGDDYFGEGTAAPIVPGDMSGLSGNSAMSGLSGGTDDFFDVE